MSLKTKQLTLLKLIGASDIIVSNIIKLIELSS